MAILTIFQLCEIIERLEVCLLGFLSEIKDNQKLNFLSAYEMDPPELLNYFINIVEDENLQQFGERQLNVEKRRIRDESDPLSWNDKVYVFFR